MKSPIDFTLLCDGNDGYAVHCPSEEDADLFLEWARRLYPQWCKAWEDGRNNYPQHGTATVYTFDSKDGNGVWQKAGLRFGDISVSEIGYTIIEFDDIYIQEELAESDQPVSLLIGGANE